MKFVYFGYDFSLPALRRLIDDGHEPLSLFTFECDNVFNFNREIIDLARDMNISFTTAKPKDSDISFFIKEGAQVFISNGYTYKIPNIDETAAYAINVHPSLLPRARGVMPSPHIIMNEPDAAGFSIHKLTSKFDGGDILYQKAIGISKKDTIDSYTNSLKREIPEALSNVTNNIADYWSNAEPQNEKEATLINKPSTQMRTLNWEAELDVLDRTARAFGTYGCLAQIEGTQYAIFAHEIEVSAHQLELGSVVEKTNSEIKIAAQGGIFTMKSYMKI